MTTQKRVEEIIRDFMPNPNMKGGKFIDIVNYITKGKLNFAEEEMEDWLRTTLTQVLSQREEEVIQKIKDYQHGFVRDDGMGEPERAPEWQVIEDLLQTLTAKNL